MTEKKDSPPPERGPDGDRVELEGVVELRTVAGGSRSERQAPVLVTAEGRGYALFLVGENPLEQPTLGALAGRCIRVAGSWRNGVVRIERDALMVRG
jgi:hypothetical protein